MAKTEDRGTRLPPDWEPSSADLAFAGDWGIDTGRVLAEFKDYWAAKPGAAGRKLDWPATWRSWCRRSGRPPMDNDKKPNLFATPQRTPAEVTWATKVLTIRNSVHATDDPKPHTVLDDAVAAAKSFLTPVEIQAIESRATPLIPLTVEHVIDHVIRSVGPKSITRYRHPMGAAGASDIVNTWVRKCGEARVIEVAQAHARERPMRCIPWIEDQLYGPLDDPQPVQTLINQMAAQARKPPHG